MQGMKLKSPRIKEWLTWLMIVPVTVLSLVGVLRYLLKLWKSKMPWTPKIRPPILDELEGLTDEDIVEDLNYRSK